jgi:hypothetical protein
MLQLANELNGLNRPNRFKGRNRPTNLTIQTFHRQVRTGLKLGNVNVATN